MKSLELSIFEGKFISNASTERWHLLLIGKKGVYFPRSSFYLVFNTLSVEMVQDFKKQKVEWNSKVKPTNFSRNWDSEKISNMWFNDYCTFKEQFRYVIFYRLKLSEKWKVKWNSKVKLLQKFLDNSDWLQNEILNGYEGKNFLFMLHTQDE